MAEKHLIVVPPRNSNELAKKIIEFFSDKLLATLDIESAHLIVYDMINFQIENTKLEDMYFQILNNSLLIYDRNH